MAKKWKIRLGSKVRDKITGFQGIVTGAAEYLTGCIQYAVKPPVDKDGKMIDAVWLDEDRLELLKDNGEPTVTTNGGPQPDAPPAG